MNVRLGFLFLGVCLTLACFSDQVSAAASYKIKLTRGYKVGAKYRIVANGSYAQGMDIKMGPRTIRNQQEDYNIRYVAVVTVKAVNAQQQSAREEHKIEKFLKIQGKSQEVLMKPGTVVVASRAADGKAQFHVGNSLVPKKIGKILQDFSDTKKPNQPSDDQMFGTSKPQKVGGSWGIDNALMAKSLQDTKTIIDPKSLSGKVTLEGVANKLGHKCLQIRANLDINRFEVPLPGALKMKKSFMKLELYGHFPVDTSKNIVHSTKSLNMNFFAEGKPNPRTPSMSMNITMKMFVEMQREFLK
ncbi:MAG: hypothetical protein EP343_30800 [Deltaproteobacteria bacterium]|nr:MAG: hypothetical protein EP343_30800 [Deltaproteobacteria bacterium]